MQLLSQKQNVDIKIRTTLETFRESLSPQSSLKHISFLLLLKYVITEQQLEVNGRPAWEALMGLEGEELIAQFKALIEPLRTDPGQNGYLGLAQVFQHLEFRAPGSSTLLKWLQNINDLSNRLSESEIFESTLRISSEQAFRNDIGFYELPKSLTDVMVKVLQPKPSDKIGVPACRAGQELVSLQEFLNALPAEENTEPENSIMGIERDLGTASLAFVRLYLKGENPKIQVQDLLKEAPQDTFDSLLSFPPVGPRLNTEVHPELTIYGNRPDFSLAYLTYILRSLKPQGRAVVLVPNGVLFNHKSLLLRKILIENRWVEAVIHLPPGALQQTNMPVSLLVISKTPKQDYSVWFHQVETPYQYLRHNRLDAFEGAIQGLYRQWQNREKSSSDRCSNAFDVPLDELLEGDHLLSLQAYQQTEQDKIIEAWENNQAIEAPPLSKLCEVFRQSVHSSNTHEGQKEGDLQVLTHGVLWNDREPLYMSQTQAQAHTCIQAGDLIVSESVRDTVRCHLVTSESGVLGANLFLIRPLRDEAGEWLVQPEYLKLYLESHFVLEKLKSGIQREHIPRIRGSVLKELPVPLIPHRETLVELMEIEKDTEQKLNLMREQRKAYFDQAFEEPQYAEFFQEAFFEQMMKERFAKSSLELSQSLKFQVANYYPYPLAYGYRCLESNTGSNERQYKEQMRLAENVLTYLGSVVLGRLAAQELLSEVLAFKSAEKSHLAFSPGHWLNHILIRGLKLLSQKSPSDFEQQLMRLKVSSQHKRLGKILKDLVERKNNFKHDRLPLSRVEYQTCSQETHGILDELFSMLDFMVNYPLRAVANMDYQPLNQTFEYLCNKYMGDHPALQKDRFHAGQPIACDALFIEIGSQVVLLDPFLKSHTCERCGHRELYFIDQINHKSRALHYKSFEHGHTIDSPKAYTLLENLLKT